MDVLADGIWEQFFTVKPEPLSREEKKEWTENPERSRFGLRRFLPLWRQHRTGSPVRRQYIAQPGGSIRDDNVIDTCDKYNIAMAFTGIRLFHH